MRFNKASMMTAAGLIAVAAFLYVTPFAGKLAAGTRLENYAKSIGIKMIEKSPPLPRVTSGSIRIPVTQSSYCWGELGCADYAGGKAMVEGVPPTVVPPGADIRIAFDHDPADLHLSVERFLDDRTITTPLTAGSFHAPTEKGIYDYGISAFWTSGDGKPSKGDTSSVFVIEVKG